MAKKAIKLEIITPDKTKLSELVSSIVAFAYEGFLGVLPGHAPLLCQLKSGKLKIKREEREDYLFVSGGLMRVEKDEVVILTEACERAEEIDVKRAEKALIRAQERLSKKEADINLSRAEAALYRALSRLKVAGKTPLTKE